MIHNESIPSRRWSELPEMPDDRQIAARRAIESLRAGVPNSTAVEALGIDQPSITRAFADRLDLLASGISHPRGFLIEGGFGTGKSHILKFISMSACKRGLASSAVTVSKETPLGDFSALFRSAILNLTYPDGRIGGTLSEIFDRLDPESKPYLKLFEAVSDGSSGLDPIYHASLMLYERHRTDISIVEELVDFWDGGRPHVPEWRRLLKDIGYGVPVIKAIPDKDLALQRFCFASLALKAAGFKGWLITVDEIELMAKFSLRARGLAYGVLAHFLQHPDPSGASCASFRDMIIIGAITPDLIGELLRTRDDRSQLTQRFDNDSQFYADSISGIEAITEPNAVLSIAPATTEQLEQAVDQVYRLYLSAYRGFSDATFAGRRVKMHDTSRSMRQSVRGWIAYWDLKRADPSYSPDIVSDTIAFDLSEDEDVEIEDALR